RTRPPPRGSSVWLSWRRGRPRPHGTETRCRPCSSAADCLSWRRAIAGLEFGSDGRTRDVAHPTAIEDVRELVLRLRARERRAVAQALTESERQSPRGRAVLSALTGDLGRALVVGFTGPPGVGKSTLVNAYILELRRAARTVAVIAVDPSSPLSGGAILGDR